MASVMGLRWHKYADLVDDAHNMSIVTIVQVNEEIRIIVDEIPMLGMIYCML